MCFASDASVGVVGVQGRSVRLPCNMTAALDDSVNLVLWFREGMAPPIYSYDLRELSGPLHWHDSALLGDRAEFKAQLEEQFLELKELTPQDEGLYKCRVDFKKAPTINNRVNLTIVVPPSSLVLQDEEGMPIRSVIGPVTEDSDLRISCVATGGTPTPDLQWQLRDELLTTAHQRRTSGVTISQLLLQSLPRQYVLADISCRAHTASVPELMAVTATIDMNLRPLEVVISEPVEPFSAGRTYDLMCTSRGSRPPALISWWRGTRRLRPIADQTWQEGNVSRSVLRLAINASLHDQAVTCSARNPKMEDAAVQDSLTLSVYYIPEVSVGLGASLDPTNIREGDDVYFECKVNANPPAYKVTWQHESQQVRQDRNEGVLVTQKSLVLQRVNRRHAGGYTCRASNVEGDSTSKPLVLKIHYAPVCRAQQVNNYGAERGETVRVSCEVVAVPTATRFHWTFNNSAESFEVPEESFSIAEDTSYLEYTPTSDFEYGTLQCRAQNAVGRQRDPCVFNIVPAARPGPPNECKVTNMTPSSVAVTCRAGYGGGLPQTFHMEVRSGEPSVLQANVSAVQPTFQVAGLENGASVTLIIYSGNTRGRSKTSVTLPVDLPSLPVKQLETRHDTEGSTSLSHSERPESEVPVSVNLASLLGALAGTVLALVVISLVGVLSIRRRCCQSAQQQQQHLTDQQDEQLCDSQTYVPSCRRDSGLPKDPLVKPSSISISSTSITGESILKPTTISLSTSNAVSIASSSLRKNKGPLKSYSENPDSDANAITSPVASVSRDCQVKFNQRTKSSADPLHFSPNALEIPLVAPTHPQFSNRSFIFDEKGLCSLDRRLNSSTPPEPAPPDPFLQKSAPKVSMSPFIFSHQEQSRIHDPLEGVCARSYSSSFAGISLASQKHESSPLSPCGQSVDSGSCAAKPAGDEDIDVLGDCRRESSV
ncbi:CD80-like immunoglobulin C2-set [Trinorchestia longiramus]|nr:CD80-like immunoglobulin C2-set [Trinorchestia longiramus]